MIGGGGAVHVAGSIVPEPLQLIVRLRNYAQKFRSALGYVLREQIAPSIIAVRVSPKLGVGIGKHYGAIGSCVLRRGQPVQLVVGESLVASSVFVVG